MRLILTYVLYCIPVILIGQNKRCLFDIPMHSRQDSIGFQNYISILEQQKSTPAIGVRSVITIPVVIHVVARDPVQSISVAQAIQQLDVLNADFLGQGENVNKLADEFKSIVGDAQMQFCLAATDPDGLPASGITFTSTTIDDIALQTGDQGRKVIHYDQLGGKTGWDPTRYLNIWVGEYGGVLGSATFPGMAPFPEEIGVVIDPAFFGSIGDAGNSGFYGRGHTLTHEIGHFFGLTHIWGNNTDESCEDTDFIDDTPNAAGPYYDCPSGEQVSCGTKNMYQNFMDFTDDRCLAAFTAGQVAVMQDVREVFYPEMVIASTCRPVADTYQVWLDQLIWSYDPSSNAYVIYNPEVWPASKEIRLYSLEGKTILEDRWEGPWSYLLDLDQIASGVYIVAVSDKDHCHVRKVIAYR